ncbi:MAG TPA: hypothetical protein PLW67_00215 [Prolixibacteraceae bacterium]|nr:hypothetical protein [Prolixibacteraceae bacterium]
MKRIFGILCGVGLGLFIWSCQDENIQSDSLDDATLKSATVALTDNKLELALSEAEYESDFFSGIEKMLWKGHFGGMKWGWKDFGHYKKGKGPDITLGGSSATYPKTITLDYGDSTVLHHGRVLKGKVIIEISAAPRTDGSTRKITYQNLVIDSVTVNGTAVSVFKGDNLTTAAENYSENIVFVTGDGKEISWKGEKVRKWVEGLATDTVRSDDVIEITGKVDASVKGGSVYLKEITVPLIRKGSCRYIVSGVIQLTIDKTLVSSVDYGSGECDATATLTKDGTTVTLDLTKNKAEKHWPHHKGK